jgi:S-adenosylmethionine synthetase
MIRIISSESVTEGHPDKVADAISDAVLDSCLVQDPESRVACETLVNTGLVMIAGEITTKGFVDFQKVARDTLERIGYTDSSYGINGEDCSVLVAVEEQSPDIAQGVNESEGDHEEQGAGDQGMMYGYACIDTEEYMPLPIFLAHALTKKMSELRKDGTLPYLRPDGKSQVSVRYDEDGQPDGVTAVVLATQHSEDVPMEVLREDLYELVIKPVCEGYLLDDTDFHINSTGRFVMGGPRADCGLTGRKIIVDTYGGIGRHGGGAFSGKDPSKVDRSAAYFARYVAKHIVAAGLAEKAEVQVAYSIGVPDPVSVCVDTFGTGEFSEDVISERVLKTFDFKPASIIEELGLLSPIYSQTSAYGHMGNPAFPWEKLSPLHIATLQHG